MLKGNVKLTGSLAIALNGVVVREVKNRVVDEGLEHITQRLLSTPGEDAMIRMAVGSNSTAAAAGDSALGTEEGRVGFDSVDVAGDRTIVYTSTFGTGVATATLTEAGLFNSTAASSSEKMFARTTFGAVTKGGDDTMTITWTITASVS
jgi:hypothetical protein